MLLKLALGSCLFYSKNFTKCFYYLIRRIPWRSQDGRMSMVMSSGRLSIPWSSALCWAQGSSCFAWSLLSSVSLFLAFLVFSNISYFYPKLCQSNVLMVTGLSITLSLKYKAAEMSLCKNKCESICSMWHEQQLDVLLKEYKAVNSNMMALMFVFDGKIKVIVFC